MGFSVQAGAIATIRLGGVGFLCGVLVSGGLLGATDPTPFPKNGHGVSYVNDRVAEGPWSIHILKIDRSREDYEWHTTLGKGCKLGLSTLREQVKLLPAELGQPLAAINGDFWSPNRQPEGDPKGLQIMRGEVVSAPNGNPVFWITADGKPQSACVTSDFKVTWPDGKTAPFGLNEGLADNEAVLYTAVIGSAPRGKAGREFVLERNGTNDWLPLRVGGLLTASVKRVLEGSAAPASPDNPVLALGSSLARQVSAVPVGAVLKLSTATSPGLSGLQTAIGGGPLLVQGGRAGTFKSSSERHPRSAVGWNNQSIFLVEVDGRQRTLSVGMTFQELADYLAKIGCTEAINLDGGASSTFMVRGQIMNSPSAGHERNMANGLVLVQKPKPLKEPVSDPPAEVK